MTNSNEFPLKPPNQRGTLSDYQQPHPTMQRSVNEISTRAFSEIGTDKPPSPTVPLSPGRHTRIPTTGNRSTVMSVAQVLLDFSENYSKETEPLSPHPSKASAMLARGTIPSGQPESSRKSSYDKYSTLPPLKEEATPTPTPSGTLSRSANISKEDIQVYGDFSVHQTLSDSTQSSDQLGMLSICFRSTADTNWGENRCRFPHTCRRCRRHSAITQRFSPTFFGSADHSSRRYVYHRNYCNPFITEYRYILRR